MEPYEKEEILEPAINLFRLNHSCSRRQILKWGGISIVGISALGPVLAKGATKPLIIMEQAQGIVVADPVRCVGCGRCELACTEFNDGKAAPTLSRIKVDRNLNFGPGETFAYREGLGNWGNGLVVQDVCKQCPHPVPCADVCPEDAIVVAPSTHARMVDLKKCTGCKLCLKACPWEMISFDPDTNRATKCFLCNGKPKCVEACPAESLSYLLWRDMTNSVPRRIGTVASLPPGKAEVCQQCHLPGARNTVEQGALLLSEAAKGRLSIRQLGRNIGRGSAFRWIDLIGAIALPVAVLSVAGHALLRALVPHPPSQDGPDTKDENEEKGKEVSE